MGELQLMTNEETIQRLAQVAQEKGDAFRVKVLRRPNASGIPESVGLLDDATVDMLLNADAWLEMFSGGGIYILQIWHAKDATMQIAVLTPPVVTGDPRPANPEANRLASWIGPSKILHPQKATPGSKPTTSVVLAGVPQKTGNPPSLPSGDPGLIAAYEQLAKAQNDLNEQRHRMDLDAVRREADERARRLEARLEDLAHKAAAPAQSNSMTELLTVVAPIFQKMMELQADQRKEMLRLEEERRKREDAQRVEEMKIRAEESKKPLIDPQVLQLIDRQSSQAADTLKGFSGMVEAQAAASRSVLQTIAAVAEMGLGPREGGGPDWGTIVREGIRGIAMVMSTPKIPAPAPAQPQLSGAPQPAQAPAPAPAAPPRAPRLDEIQKQIVARLPPAEVAAALIDSFSDPAVQAEVQYHRGLIQVLSARLGDQYASDPANSTYLSQLLAELQSQYAARQQAAAQPPPAEEPAPESDASADDSVDGEING